MFLDKCKKLFIVLKPPLRFLSQTVVPSVLAIVAWDALGKATQVLAFVLLLTLWLKNIGVNVNIVQRVRNTRWWRWLTIIARSSTPMGKFNEDYFEETSKMLADTTLQVVEQTKKIKEEKLMKKFFIKMKDFLKGNKTMVTAYLSATLLFLDYFFGVSRKTGLPQDVVYTIAVVIVGLLYIALGIEGWTSVSTNNIRSEEKKTKTATAKLLKKHEAELKKIDKKIEAIEAFRMDGLLPPDKQSALNELLKSKQYYQQFLEQHNAKQNE